MSEPPVIAMQDIARRFEVGGQDVHALRDVDLRIERGEYLSIMGPSGSGKSTLLNIVGLLDNPSEGDYLFFGDQILDAQLAFSLDDLGPPLVTVRLLDRP